jgi:hypothetical protein
MRVACWLFPATALVCGLTWDFRAEVALPVRGVVLGGFSAFVLLRFGLDAPLRAQLAGMVPVRLGFVRNLLLKSA